MSRFEVICCMRLILLTCLFIFSFTWAQGQDAPLRISHLTGDFYIYTTYNNYKDSKVPANGMYLVTSEGAFLFDTPWDTTQFQPLLDSIRTRHGKEVKWCVATHWHSDKTAGLEYYKKLGIQTYTTVRTDEQCRLHEMPRAQYLMTRDTVFQAGKYRFETYYPGEGHTSDNIIIWFSKEKILYGGCLIKGADAENLGFLGDANVTEYLNTLEKVRKRCQNPVQIITSHHDWRNIQSLKHSIELARELKSQKQ